MKTLKLILLGMVIYIAINLFMLAASLLFSTYEGTDNTYLVSVNSLAAAIPAGLVAFALTRVMKTANRKDALLYAGIWTALQLVFFFIVGLLNQTLPFIFGAFGLYVLIVCVFLGPVVYAWIKKLP